jgi:putative ABC transport system substrate-binding protein
VGRSGRNRWKTRRGTRTTPPHDHASLPVRLDGDLTSPQDRFGTGPARAILLPSGQILEEPHLGRAGYDYQLEEWRPLGRRRGDLMKRRELLLALATGMMSARAVRAQQKAMPVIGTLWNNYAGPGPGVTGFRQGLGETGYIDGQNVAIEYRFSEGRNDRLPGLANDLVRRKVDLILAAGDPAVLAAKNASSTIPIVFSFGGDPVEAGLVVSFARPGGNLTGMAIMMAELIPKRFQLLTELVPTARVFALMVNPNSPGTEPMIREMQHAARAKGVQLHVLNAGTESEIDGAFATLVQEHVDALVVSNDTFFFSAGAQLLTLADRHAVPASFFSREFAAAGGLISYGPNITAVYRNLGIYAGKILNGAKPTDLPVEQPTTFELVVNLKTAQALGLTVPPSILARADEVIE